MTTKNDLEKDKAKANNTFKKFAAPILQDLYKATLIDLETDSSRLAKILDRACGCDYLLKSDNAVITCAARVTHNWQRDYHTFTLRKQKYNKPSEFSRLQTALNTGGILPTLFVQVYPSENGKSAVVCICQTSKLLESIAAGNAQLKNKFGVDFFSIDTQKVSGSKKISVTLPNIKKSAI